LGFGVWGLGFGVGVWGLGVEGSSFGFDFWFLGLDFGFGLQVSGVCSKCDFWRHNSVSHVFCAIAVE